MTRLHGHEAVTLDLTDDDRAASVELLTTEIKSTRYPFSPRLRPLKSILGKLGVGSMHPPAYPPGQPSSAPTRKVRSCADN